MQITINGVKFKKNSFKKKNLHVKTAWIQCIGVGIASTQTVIPIENK
jgi:hypothetical protein